MLWGDLGEDLERSRQGYLQFSMNSSRVPSLRIFLPYHALPPVWCHPPLIVMSVYQYCDELLYSLRYLGWILVKRWLLTHGVIGPRPCNLRMVSDVSCTSPYILPDHHNSDIGHKWIEWVYLC